MSYCILYFLLSAFSCCLTIEILTTTSSPAAPQRHYHQNIYPNPNMVVSNSVNITSVDDYVETMFYVEFGVKNEPCYNPMISFTYEQIDIDLTSEYISLYDDNNALIKQCQGNGGSGSQCGVFWDCLSNQSLGIDQIDVGSNYTIQVVESADTDALCVGHEWSINALLTLTCNEAQRHYYENIYPNPNMITSRSVNITSVDDDIETTFYVEFGVQSKPCYNPMISFRYEQIDIEDSSEYISLYDENNLLIKQCQGNGGSDTQCGVFWDCLSHQPLGIDQIDAGSNYTIQVVESAETDALCVDHEWSINALITLTCNEALTNKEALCITATMDSAHTNYHIVGSYEPAYFNITTNSTVYFCSECGDGMYLYSYVFTSGNSMWLIGVSPISLTVRALCEVYNVNLASYSCLGNWRVFSAELDDFELIIDMKVKKCSDPTEPYVTPPSDVDDILISGTTDFNFSITANVFGTYTWSAYNPYVSDSNVYLCLDCNERGDTMYLYYDDSYWIIGYSYLQAIYMTAYCSLPHMNIIDDSCIGYWKYWDAENQIWVTVDDMKAVLATRAPVVSTEEPIEVLTTLDPESVLSTEAIIGIVIAVLIVLIACILAVYCIKKKKKNKKGYDTVQTEIPQTTSQITQPPVPAKHQIDEAMPTLPLQTYQVKVQVPPPPLPSENVQMVKIVSVPKMKSSVHEWFYKNVKISELDANKYADMFIDNGWDDLTTFRLITKEDLVDMGISKLYHRKLIFGATQVTYP